MIRFACTSSSASTARCRGPPSGTARPDLDTSNGPSMPNASGAGSRASGSSAITHSQVTGPQPPLQADSKPVLQATPNAGPTVPRCAARGPDRSGGLTWDVKNTPILSGSVEGTAGVYGLAFRTANLGLAVGGDFLTPDVTSHVSALSYLGHPWVSPVREPSGVRFAAAWLPFTLTTAVTVGINGSDVSYDAGQHWTRFDNGEFNTVGCAADGTCWATGDAGRVAVLRR